MSFFSTQMQRWIKMSLLGFLAEDAAWGLECPVNLRAVLVADAGVQG
jgi:hypothetical protein